MFVFEKLDGGDLLSHIQKKKVFTEREASDVIREIASALSFIHGMGMYKITCQDLLSYSDVVVSVML